MFVACYMLLSTVSNIPIMPDILISIALYVLVFCKS